MMSRAEKELEVSMMLEDEVVLGAFIRLVHKFSSTTSSIRDLVGKLW